jgi:hypothetical protein
MIPRLSFGDEVTLAVEHASNVTFDDSGEPNPTDLVLFLDGKAMPDFDAPLLGLMGITSGTYVGLKIPEKKV